jgi:tetratricopeptide (TPR) repeat protein
MNFNPQMFDQMKNMDPNMMKNASDMIGNMSDNDLKNTLNMMGMGHMSPEMFRTSANMMKNMDPNQINQMKDMASKMNPNSVPGFGAPTQPQAQSTAAPKLETQKSSGQFSKIEKLKGEGNDFFKQQQYDDASSKYFEAIIEIEEIKARGNVKNAELDELEISCRLNYCNVKSKVDEYGTVLSQAKEVLKLQPENGKGLFRQGQAYFHLKKYQLAIDYLSKAAPKLPTDKTVQEYLEKAQKEIKPKEEEISFKKDTSKNEEDNASTQPDNSSSQTEHDEKPKQSKQKKKSNAPTIDKTIAEEIKTNKKYEEPKKQSNPKHEHSENCSHGHHHQTAKEEVKISDETQNNMSNSTTTANVPFVDDKVLKGHEEIKKMKPEQMDMMTNYLKGMDNSFIRNMMKGQTGVELSDADIQNFKNMMTPDTLKTFANMDPSMLAYAKQMGGQMGNGSTAQMPATTASISSSNTNNQQVNYAPTTTTTTAPPPGFQGMPGMGGMPPNMDMSNIGSMLTSDTVTNMIDMMANNPAMLQGMMGMLGDNHPLAGLLKNKKPEELAVWMKRASKLLKFAQKASPLFSFVKKWYKVMLAVLVAYIIYRYMG